MKRFFSVLLLCAWATVMNAHQIWYVTPTASPVPGCGSSWSSSNPVLYNTILFGNTVFKRTLPCNITYNQCDMSGNNVFMDVPNEDYRLMPGNNPCKNSGTWPSTFPFNTISTDLDHNSRISNGGDPGSNNNKVDKGAYELQ